MSITWQLDVLNHDLVIQKGTLAITTGADEIRQRILVTLKHEYQEYFLDVEGGIPWYEVLLGSNDISLVNAVLRDAVLSVPGVDSITEFQCGMSANRHFHISLVAAVTPIGTSDSTTVSISTNFGG